MLFLRDGHGDPHRSAVPHHSPIHPVLLKTGQQIVSPEQVALLTETLPNVEIIYWSESDDGEARIHRKPEVTESQPATAR
jgi:hypothetical protein